MGQARREPGELLRRLREGDRRALSRLLTLAEAGDPDFGQVAEGVQAACGQALRVGITGPAGVGKSTLIDHLTQALRAGDTTVAVLATDPSSHRTGGALLGDRVRLSAATPDEGLFFRSIASRGGSGGLSAAAHDLLDLLDAYGFEWLLVEAVGAGQTEVEVGFAADLTVVVLSPSGGDSVQAMKAGLMEVGDVFVINKCDLPEAEQAVETVRMALQLREHEELAEIPPVLAVSALKGDGIEGLASQIRERAAYLRASGALDRRRRERLARRVRIQALRLLDQHLTAGGVLEGVMQDERGTSSPWRLAREVVRRLGGGDATLPGTED